jgi:hypothetical protein
VLAVDGEEEEEEEEEVAGRPAGPSHQLEERLWQLQRARQLGPQTATVALKATGRPAAFGVQRVGGNDHVGKVEVGQQWPEPGDLLRGTVDLALGEHGARGVVHRG